MPPGRPDIYDVFGDGSTASTYRRGRRCVLIHYASLSTAQVDALAWGHISHPECREATEASGHAESIFLIPAGDANHEVNAVTK
jgi:hypothetical protein